MSDAPLSECPACGASAFSKQLTAAGFQLKGSGWYATDFRNGSSPAPAAESEGAKPAGETPATTDSGAKPADNTGSKAPVTQTKDGKDGKSKSTESKAAPAESKPKPAESKTDSKPGAKPGAASAASGDAGRASAAH